MFRLVRWETTTRSPKPYHSSRPMRPAMSRAQSFTSTAAWPKSKPRKWRCSCGLETERGKTMATLQSRLDEFKKEFESGPPPYNAPREAFEPTHRATAELKAAGIEKPALKPGARA